jgi:hypothetical protein
VRSGIWIGVDVALVHCASLIRDLGGSGSIRDRRLPSSKFVQLPLLVDRLRLSWSARDLMTLTTAPCSSESHMSNCAIHSGFGFSRADATPYLHEDFLKLSLAIVKSDGQYRTLPDRARPSPTGPVVCNRPSE